MGYVAVGNEGSTPVERNGEDRRARRPLARRRHARTRTRSASRDQRTTAGGGVSLAAVLGGTLLGWGGGMHDAPPRRP